MNPELIGIGLVLKHFQDKYLSPLDNAHPQPDVEHADSGPGNNLSGGSNAGEGSNAKCGVKKSEMGTDHRTNPPPAQNNLPVPVLADPKDHNYAAQCPETDSGEARESTPNLKCETEQALTPASCGGQNPSVYQETVIEVRRYGENGEPLFVQVLGCACYPTDLKTPNEQLVWTAYPEGEVVETNGSFRAGEVIQLSPEEQETVSVEAEREYLREEL